MISFWILKALRFSARWRGCLCSLNKMCHTGLLLVHLYPCSFLCRSLVGWLWMRITVQTLLINLKISQISSQQKSQTSWTAKSLLPRNTIHVYMLHDNPKAAIAWSKAPARQVVKSPPQQREGYLEETQLQLWYAAFCLFISRYSDGLISLQRKKKKRKKKMSTWPWLTVMFKFLLFAN